jgi:hypothetical protein
MNSGHFIHILCLIRRNFCTFPITITVSMSTVELLFVIGHRLSQTSVILSIQLSGCDRDENTAMTAVRDIAATVLP